MRNPPSPWPSLGLNLPYVEGSMDGATPRWSDIEAMAQAAEAVGFDAVWVSDHVGFGDPDAGWSGAWESWTLLSALAVSTSRVRLGSYVTAVPYRNPALLAKMAETLDEVSGGRLILALGAGWNEPEFRAYGFPWERRFDRFEDGLRIITSMLRTGRADHEGRVESARGALVRPRGPRPDGLPVMVGAAAPRMLRLAAELADEWNAGMRTPAGLAPMLAALEAACEEVGRDSSTIRRSAEAMVEIGASAGADDDLDARGSWDDPLRGSAAQVAAGLRRYRDLGMDHVQVQLRPNRIESVTGFASVIEDLRAG
jgi:probable F420-dependent oxidoreductase